jgi:hypothetical protein
MICCLNPECEKPLNPEAAKFCQHCRTEGVICFHLLSGVNPWSLWKTQGYGWLNQWEQHVKMPLEADLKALLGQLLQVEPERRYQSAEAVLQALQASAVAAQQAAVQQTQLDEYRQEFKRAVEAGYLLSGYVRDVLRRYQQTLGLEDVDIQLIEAPILQKAEVEAQQQQWQAEELRRQEAEQQQNLRQQEVKRIKQQEAEQLNQQELQRQRAKALKQQQGLLQPCLQSPSQPQRLPVVCPPCHGRSLCKALSLK